MQATSPAKSLSHGPRIVELRIESFKGVRAVELRPNGASVIPVEGRNGAGKSSVLDAVWAVLAKGAAPDEPIRKGHKKATIEIDFGDFKAVQTFTPSGGTIKVTRADGQNVDSPKEFLSSMCGRLWNDPLAFGALQPREQVDVLKRITGTAEACSAIERDKAAALAAKGDAQRDRKQAEAQLAACPLVDGPDEEVSAADLVARLSAASKQRDENENARRWLRGKKADASALRQRVEAAEKELAVLRGNLLKVEDELAENGPAAEALVDPDLAAIQRDIAEMESRNDAARRRRTRRDLEAKKAAAEKAEREAARRVEECEARRDEVVKAAKMPVKGLAFDETGVRLNGVPFAQANSAAQLRAGVGIVLADNPTIRVVLIRQGSLLDSAGMADLHRVMEEYDAQALVERVTDGGTGTGFFIEDGELAEGGAT